MVTGFLTGPIHAHELPACDFCGRRFARFRLSAGAARRAGLKVYLCRHCGLVQSLPRIDRTGDAPCRRRVRRRRLGQCALRQGLSHPGGDGGAGAPCAIFDDAAGAAGCGFQPRQLRRARFWTRRRNAQADRGRAGRTLRRFLRRAAAHHADPVAHRRHRIWPMPVSTSSIPATPSSISPIPSRALKDHARVLKPGGLLVLDAPNIALIGGDDIVEEWFIDKHLYHFSHVTLRAHDRGGGLRHHRRIPIPTTPSIFSSSPARPAQPAPTFAADPAEVRAAPRRCSHSYRQTRAANLRGARQSRRGDRQR